MGLFPTKELTKIADRMEATFTREINEVEAKLSKITVILEQIRERLPSA